MAGRKHKAGSITRISSPEIEGIVEQAFKDRFKHDEVSIDQFPERIEKVTLKKSSVQIQFNNGAAKPVMMEVQRPSALLHDTQIVSSPADREPDPKLLQGIVRANAWLSDLASGRYTSVEELAAAVQLHPKVIRQGLRLAFLSPEITSALLEKRQPEWLTLRQIPKRLPLIWTAHPRLRRCVFSYQSGN